MMAGSLYFLGVITAVTLSHATQHQDKLHFLQNNLAKKYEDIFAKTNEMQCSLTRELEQEIRSYRPVANEIIHSILYGKFKGRTWNTLQKFVDKFGSRIAGSENLENAIDYMLMTMRQDGLENVHGEDAEVPHWVRGTESATLLLPREHKLAILGLGLTVGTSEGGITAEVLVVSSFKEMKKKARLAKGKIVVVNERYINYFVTVSYRSRGASKAARVGALAVLIRSITPFSIYSLHTGMLDYQNNVTRIPAAAITIEDAEMLHRMQQRGERIIIHLEMSAQNLPPVISRNTVGELTGVTHPHEVVLVSGHLDSWDVGQGAMDDGGGAFISWNSVVVLKSLGLRPRRTIRAVLWTAEEEGLIGSGAYFQSHRHELEKMNFVMESDEGTFEPYGLNFKGNAEAQCIMREVLKLLEPINATQFEYAEDPGPDISYWTDVGIPGSGLLNRNERYFWFHHTEADTMTVEDTKNLDLCTAVWAVVSYVVADLSVQLPRDEIFGHL